MVAVTGPARVGWERVTFRKTHGSFDFNWVLSKLAILDKVSHKSHPLLG